MSPQDKYEQECALGLDAVVRNRVISSICELRGLITSGGMSSVPIGHQSVGMRSRLGAVGRNRLIVAICDLRGLTTSCGMLSVPIGHE